MLNFLIALGVIFIFFLVMRGLFPAKKDIEVESQTDRDFSNNSILEFPINSKEKSRWIPLLEQGKAFVFDVLEYPYVKGYVYLKYGIRMNGDGYGIRMNGDGEISVIKDPAMYDFLTSEIGSRANWKIDSFDESKVRLKLDGIISNDELQELRRKHLFSKVYSASKLKVLKTSLIFTTKHAIAPNKDNPDLSYSFNASKIDEVIEAQIMAEQSDQIIKDFISIQLRNKVISNSIELKDPARFFKLHLNHRFQEMRVINRTESEDETSVVVEIDYDNLKIEIN